MAVSELGGVSVSKVKEPVPPLEVVKLKSSRAAVAGAVPKVPRAINAAPVVAIDNFFTILIRLTPYVENAQNSGIIFNLMRMALRSGQTHIVITLNMDSRDLEQR